MQPMMPKLAIQTKRKEVETSQADDTFDNQKELVEWKTQVLDGFDVVMRKFQAQYKKWNSHIQQKGEQAKFLFIRCDFNLRWVCRALIIREMNSKKLIFLLP